MMFFPALGVVPYPTTKDELKARILQDATVGKQRTPVAFFDQYFDADGGKEHPILGDLSELTKEIDALWDSARYGLNLVSGLIKHRLGQIEQAERSLSGRAKI